VGTQHDADHRVGDPVSFSVTLPLPPSINGAYFNASDGSRGKTKTYRNWRKNAVLAIYAQVRADLRVGGAIEVEIYLPEGMAGDADNRVKALLDALVDSRRVDDDKNVQRIVVERCGDTPGMVNIVVRPYERLWPKARAA
jgi:Holliday junction resolvase RusA-like endonuclease